MQFMFCSQETVYPTKAKIKFDAMFGRGIAFFTQDKQQLVFHDDDGGQAGIIEYNGSIDIKRDIKKSTLYCGPNKTRIDLSKIKKVREYDSSAAALFLPGLSYFYPRQFPSYLKKELLYKDDGSKVERTTIQHRTVQAMQLAIGMGALYIGYSFCKNLFSSAHICFLGNANV